jgi:SAM-dependent MidA family methyltransferase
MENALYGADGYYAAGHARSGRDGDYFTAPDVSPLFGRLLAAIFGRWAETLPASPFHLVEAGAGEGVLSQSVARALRQDVRRSSDFSYIAVERSAARRQKLEFLGEEMPGPFQILSDFSALPNGSLRGCIFANELIDAFPVHKIRKRGDKLEEGFVEQTGGARRWAWGAPSTPEIPAYFERLGIKLPEGYETEVNLAMRAWVRDAARILRWGWIVLIDYGRPANLYYHPERAEGTLRGFSGHKRCGDVLSSSRMDLTADVDFTSLALDGREAGLTPLAFMEMGSFLSGGARLLAENKTEDPSAWAGFRYLAHPEGMGGAFHVLILGKGVDPFDWPFEGNRLARLALPT